MAVNINSGKVSLILFWNAVEHDTQPFMASADEHTGHSLTGGAVVFPGFGVLVAGVGAAVVVVPSGATVVVVPSGAVVVSSGSGAAVVFLATFPSPVGASVGASVGALVGASVGASVGAAVVSVGASVGTCDVVGTAVVFGIVVVVVVSGGRRCRSGWRRFVACLGPSCAREVFLEFAQCRSVTRHSLPPPLQHRTVVNGVRLQVRPPPQQAQRTTK